jgi:hypothetical protein
MKGASGFYADSLEMLLDTMCNVLGMVIFITLTLAQLVQHSPAAAPVPPAAVLTADLAAVNASNSIVEADIQQLSRRLQETHSFKTNVSLPFATETTRERWPVILRYGRLYPLYFISRSSPNGRTKNIQSLAWDGQNVEPRWGQGEEPETAVAELVREFRSASKTNIFLEFWVYDDSFAAFNRAKETAVKLGFQYGWEPLPHNMQLRLGSSGQRIPAQN